MRVLRGRVPDRDADRERTAAMLTRTAETGESAIRVWTPARVVAFGRRDARAEGYDRARDAAEARGFPTVERSVGGRAVAYTGTTVAFAHAVPVDGRDGIDARYDAATETVLDALRGLGVDARPGEPPASFCPGAHSIQSDGKLVGIAQRVRQDAALVSGIVVVADEAEIAAVLTPVYEALDVAFDPASVGSVAGAGGPADPVRVARVVESAFVGDRDHEVLEVA
ncbi:lipoate--protein ligase family protein [Salinirubrum litoreum]|uniref:Biotin/lipoate A/B protein ligase family protein n=1 Tax=Salinirubrum litoreum TaxID=1126234 RepID=A0ABD5RCX9_9EURY|nr:lipoate--protein ligase family protein [Salinirubrum litoreum]